MATVLESRDAYQNVINSQVQGNKNLKGTQIVTDISVIKNWYLGEEMHQQYLDKHKWAFCGTKNNGAACPIDFGKK